MLNDKLSNVKWGEYRILDLFDVKTTKSKDKNKIVFANDGEYEFIGRSSVNNGIQGYVNYMNYDPNPAGTFSLVQVGKTVMLYRPNEWYASQNIFILTPKDKEIINNYLFFETVVNKSLYMYSEAYIYPTLDDVKNHTILLPINDDGSINYKLMASYIKEVIDSCKKQMFTDKEYEFEKYLKLSSIKNYELTNEERKILSDFEEISFDYFNLTDIFDVFNTKNILSRNIKTNSGVDPYLCASIENNGISSYISYKNELKDKGNCIFIGGKTFVVTYQEKDFYSNDSHNLALYFKNINESSYNYLFFATCINKNLSHKYSWDDSVSKAKIKKDLLLLPAVDGKLYIDKINEFMIAITKLVLTDIATEIKEYKNKLKLV